MNPAEYYISPGFKQQSSNEEIKSRKQQNNSITID